MKTFALFAAVPALVLALASYPNLAHAETVRVSRVVPSFTKIELSLAGNVEVRRGSTCKVEIEADRDALPNIETEVNGGLLRIESGGKSMNNYGKVKYYLTMATVESVHLSGAGNILLLDSFESPSLKLDLDGAGDIRGSFTAGNVKVELSGTGSVDLKGSADNLKAELSGVGSLDAVGMQAKLVKVDLSGVGTAKVYPVDALDAAVSGTGSVRYKGTPKTLKKEVSGMGSVKQL